MGPRAGINLFCVRKHLGIICSIVCIIISLIIWFCMYVYYGVRGGMHDIQIDPHRLLLPVAQ